MPTLILVFFISFFEPGSINVTEEVVPQLFNEGFPSCGSLVCRSWNSGYTG